MKPDLQVHMGPLTLKNPVMPASGTYGYGSENIGCFDLSEIGALVTKSVSLSPRPGNPPPRIFETASGVLNAVGIPSEGVEKFCSGQLPILRHYDTSLIVSVAGSSMADFAAVAEILSLEPGIDALELNLSCPNLGDGIPFASDPGKLKDVLRAVRRTTELPLIAKLSPNVSDISEMARVVEAEGVEIVCLANTLVGMAIDIKTRRPVLGNRVGGLSGPAIKPVAVRMVYEVSQAVNIPVIGVGGIMEAAAAVEFMLAGASAVQVGVANFYNPMTMVEIRDGIARYLEENGFSSVSEIVGLAWKS